MAVEVRENGSSLEVGRVQPLFGGLHSSAFSTEYDAALDGQRFLVAIQTGLPASEPLTLVQNWTAGLKK